MQNRTRQETTADFSGVNTALTLLADVMFDATVDSLPEGVLAEGQRCIVDTLGCIVAGAVHPDSMRVRNAESTLFSERPLGRTLSRARSMGYAGDVLELNDLVGGHASIGTVSAVLAHAMSNPCLAEEAVLAAIVGIETTSRLFDAHSWNKKPYSENGTVVTSVVSSIGVSAAVAKLRGLPRDQFRQALLIASATAGWGPSEVIFGQGGSIKSSQFGAGPAEIGLRAVELARNGVSGPPRILESKMGFFNSVATEWDPGTLTGGNGWRILLAQRKLHACCGYIHSTLDALKEIDADQDGTLHLAKRIVCRVPSFVHEAVAKSVPPHSENDARFHLQYMAAVVASGSYPIRPVHSVEFEKLLNRELRSILSRIEVEILQEIPAQDGNRFNSAEVWVHWESHEAHAVCHWPRGSLGVPLTDEDLREKFIHLLAQTGGRSKSRDLFDQLLSTSPDEFENGFREACRRLQEIFGAEDNS